MTAYTTLLTKIGEYLKNYGTQQSILPFIPKPIKWALLLLLLLNGRNFPLVWHIRVFRYFFYTRTYHWYKDLVGFESKVQKQRREIAIFPIERNVFSVHSLYASKAVIATCDYNFHMSNSSYAVALDIARMKFFLDYFPLFYADGVRIFFAGCVYTKAGISLNFIKEIRINSKYEVITSIGSWDNKWFYVLSHFVTYSKRASKVNDPSRTILGERLPLNTIVHCTAVSRTCFKIKGITIPPVIVMACLGYQITPSKFAEVHSWRTEKGKKRIRDFYAGSWKNVSEEERWWETAFEPIEPERIYRLTAIANYTGLPQARSS